MINSKFNNVCIGKLLQFCSVLILSVVKYHINYNINDYIILSYYFIFHIMIIVIVIILLLSLDRQIEFITVSERREISCFAEENTWSKA